MIHVRNLVKSRGDSKNASSGLASASVSLSSGQRILVLDPKDGTRGGQGHSRTRRIHYTRSTSYATCRGCSRARIPDSTGRGRGVSRPVPRDDEPSRREDGEGCLRARPRNAFPIYVEIPRVLPKEDQLKGNSVLLGTHNQQRRIFKKFFWLARGPAELRRGVIGLCRAAV